MSEQEKWHSIPGAPGYEVSSFGRVRSLPRTIATKNGPMRWSGRILAQTINRGTGYARVVIRRNGRSQVTCRPNVLVLEAFIGPRPDGMDCLHRNGNKTDNRLSNLHWGTRSENIRDTVAHGTHNHAKKTHCPQGHAYTPENTYSPPCRPGSRYCRACNRARNKARKAYLRSLKVSTPA